MSASTRIYPNPASNRIHVIFPSNYKGIVHLQIIDIFGRIYELGKLNLKTSKYDFNVDISGLFLTTGQYFVRITSDKQDIEVIKIPVLNK